MYKALGLFLICVVLSGVNVCPAHSSSGQPGELPSQALLMQVRHALLHLDQTEYQGTGYDYWPRGGLRNTYEHIATFFTYAELVHYYGGPVFLDGPHSETSLHLTASDDFGRYDPEFVVWLSGNAIYFVQNAELITLTAPLFERYLARLGWMYYHTYRFTRKHPAWWSWCQQHYAEQLQQHTLPAYFSGKQLAKAGPYAPQNGLAELYRRYGFHNEILDQALYFWLRRGLDGTDWRFFDLLEIVLAAYTPEYFE